MARMLEAYLAFARGDLGEQPAPTDMAAFLDELQGRCRAPRPQGDRAVPRLRRSSPCSPAAFKRCLGNLVSNAARYAPVDRDHRPSRSPLADDHRRRRRAGHSGGACARRCSSRSCGSTTRATRTRAAPGSASPSRATSRARMAATSRSAISPLGGLRAHGARAGVEHSIARSSLQPRRLRSRLRRLDAGCGARRAGSAPGSGTGRRRSRPSAAALARSRSSAAMAAVDTVFVVVDPGAAALGRTSTPGPARAPRRSGRTRRCRRRSASMLRAHRHGVERQRQRRIAPRRAQSERIASLYGASASSRRISTSNSRSRGGSSAMSASPPSSTMRSMSLTWAAKIASVEPNSARRAESVMPARPATSARPICSKGCSASRAISASMALARSVGAARWRSRRGFAFGFGFAGWLAGHDRPPWLRSRLTLI